MKPLWQRALEARALDKALREKYRQPRRPKGAEPSPPPEAKTGPRRKYPPARVGDHFETGVVVRLANPIGSNERVRIRCPNGHERDAYVFNLRKQTRCPACPRWRPVETTVNGVRQVSR